MTFQYRLHKLTTSHITERELVHFLIAGYRRIMINFNCNTHPVQSTIACASMTENIPFTKLLDTIHQYYRLLLCYLSQLIGQ
jgi:hypothetical protein